MVLPQLGARHISAAASRVGPPAAVLLLLLLVPLLTARAAFANDPIEATPLACVGDCDGDGAVEIGELTRTVAIALESMAPSLIGPLDSGSVCVGNQGSVNAGEFLVEVNGETQVLVDELSSGIVRCFNVVGIFRDANVIVDVDDRADETREDNNELSYPTPGPTSCDVIRPQCTPTPGR